jgi:polysaccharide pyruvyl transferase WcaK-like protein
VFFLYGGATGGTRVLSDSPDDSVTVLNCRMSPRSRPSEHLAVILVLALLYRFGIQAPARRNPWLRALLDADLIGDIRGGDSFSDIYGLRKFVQGSLPLLTVALLGRPYVMLPQTYGPFRGRITRILAASLLKRATAIYTRDRNCEGLVAKLCGRTPAFCPDVAFTLEARQPHHVPLTSGDTARSARGPIVGVNVSGLLYMGGYTGRNMFGLRCEYRTLIDQLIGRLLSSTDAEILLVPHVFGSEREETARDMLLHSHESRFPGRIFGVAEPLSERELKWVIGQTDFFVGSRMHACIAALSQSVPAVGLAYSDKFLGVFESIGMGDATIDLRKALPEAVIEQTLAMFERRGELRAELAERIPRIQESVRLTFERLCPPSGTATGNLMVRTSGPDRVGAII